MKRTRKFLVLGLLVPAILLALWPEFRVHRLDSAFNNVKENDDIEIVLLKMGRPWKREGCGEYLGGHSAGCVEEFIYAHPFAPYVPEYWVIDFNSNHRVISKVRLVSP